MPETTTENLQWIPGFENRYKAGELGSVFSYVYKDDGIPLEQYQASSGYMHITLTHEDGTTCPMLVHRLVLFTFRGSPVGTANQGCHRNGERGDNRLANLYWGTPEENAADRVKHGTVPRGEDHHHSKLTEAQVVEIRERIYANAGSESFASIAKDYDVQLPAITAIANNWSWVHAGGPDCSDVPRCVNARPAAIDSEETARRLLSEFNEGASQLDLGEKYGVSSTTVHAVIHQKGPYAHMEGLVGENRRIKRSRITHDEAVAFRADYAAGAASSLTELAERYDFSVLTASRIINARRTYAYFKEAVSPPPRIPTETAQQIRDEYVAGKTQKALAAEYDLLLSTIQAIVKRQYSFRDLEGPEIEGAKRSGARPSASDDTALAVRERYAEGASISTLVTEFGVGPKVVKTIAAARSPYDHLGPSIARPRGGQYKASVLYAQEMFDDYCAGASRKELRDKYKAPKTVVYDVTNKRGAYANLEGDAPIDPRRRRSVSEDMVLAIRSEYAAGEKESVLAKRYSVSVATARHIIRAVKAYVYLGESIERAKKPLPDPAMAQEIFDTYCAGTSRTDLYKQYGIGVYGLGLILAKKGQYANLVGVPSKKPNRRRIPEEAVQAIRIGYGAGMSYAELEHKYNISSPSVRNIVAGKGAYTHLLPVQR